MRSNKRFDLSYLLLFPYLAVAFIPWLKYRVQFRFVLPVILLWAIVALLTRRQIQLPRKGLINVVGVGLFLAMYQGMALLFLPFGHSDGMSYIDTVDLVLSLFSLVVFHLSVCNGRLRELRVLIVFCFLCISIAGGMTITGQSYVEGGSRTLTAAASVTANMFDIADAREAGIGGYGYVYGMGLLIFPILFCSKFVSAPMKVCFTCFAAVFLVTVYHAGYTILVVGVLFAGVMFLSTKFGEKLRTLKIFGIVAILVFTIILANPPIINFLVTGFQSVSNRLSKEEYSQRAESVADAISGDEETYAIQRSKLYWMSWDVFLKHPFFGVGKWDYQIMSSRRGDDNIGGHSFIFDLLGSSGLAGGIIFILFFICYVRYLRVMSSLVLGFKWWPAYYIFIFSAGFVAYINTLGGYLIFGDLLLIIPALPLFFKESVMVPQKNALRFGSTFG